MVLPEVEVLGKKVILVVTMAWWCWNGLSCCRSWMAVTMELLLVLVLQVQEDGAACA